MSDLPPPPSAQATPTQVVGQQTAPSTAVPVGGIPQSTSFSIGRRPTNSLAVVSLAAALVAPFGHLVGVGGITLTVISLITGHMARHQIKQTGEGGSTIALIGLIISYIHLIITVLVVIFLFSLVVTFLTFLFHSVATGG